MAAKRQNYVEKIGRLGPRLSDLHSHWRYHRVSRQSKFSTVNIICRFFRIIALVVMVCGIRLYRKHAQRKKVDAAKLQAALKAQAAQNERERGAAAKAKFEADKRAKLHKKRDASSRTVTMTKTDSLSKTGSFTTDGTTEDK